MGEFGGKKWIFWDFYKTKTFVKNYFILFTSSTDTAKQVLKDYEPKFKVKWSKKGLGSLTLCCFKFVPLIITQNGYVKLCKAIQHFAQQVLKLTAILGLRT